MIQISYKEQAKIPLTHEELQAEFYKLAESHNSLCAYIEKLMQNGQILSKTEALTKKAYGL
jgi:uncharacterized protein YdcH (DUF465 family)